MCILKNSNKYCSGRQDNIRKITLCDGDELNHNIEAIISIRINLIKYLDENELIYFFD